MKKFVEGHPRSVAKVFSWRATITVSHIVNAFIVTGSLVVGLKIAGLATIINSILYWSHERAWNYFQWNRLADNKKVFHESQGRSIAKIVTWRVLITLSNFFIPYFMTGSWQTGLAFLTLATVVNMILYWAHERVWNAINWSKKVKDDTTAS